MKFECVSCRVTLEVPDTAAGKKTTCPSCGARQAVPARMSLPADEPIYEADAVEPVAPSADWRSQAAAGMSIEPDAAPSAGERRPCPSCGELILRGALKCRFCGDIFDPKLRPRAGGGADDNTMNALEWFLCICCAGIGCIVGIVYAVQGKPKGSKMIGISLLVWVIGIIIQAAIAAANRNGRGF